MLWLLRLVLTPWGRCLCGLTAVCGCDLCICRVVWVSCYCVRRCGWGFAFGSLLLWFADSDAGCGLLVLGVCGVC